MPPHKFCKIRATSRKEKHTTNFQILAAYGDGGGLWIVLTIFANNGKYASIFWQGFTHSHKWVWA